MPPSWMLDWYRISTEVRWELPNPRSQPYMKTCTCTFKMSALQAITCWSTADFPVNFDFFYNLFDPSNNRDNTQQSLNFGETGWP